MLNTNPQRRCKQLNLFRSICTLTILFIFSQLLFFAIHFHISDIIDSLTGTSVQHHLFYPSVILPIIAFIAIQIMAYLLFICWIWFIACSTGELFKWQWRTTYWAGLIVWFLACYELLALNQYYFPHSFFAISTEQNSLLVLDSLLLGSMTLIAFFNFIWCKRHIKMGSLFLLLGFSLCASAIYYNHAASLTTAPRVQAMPNIILIGIDSLRPDFTGYYGNKTIHTPYINQFLSEAVTFEKAYAPLARTFPSWVSILTAQYPKHTSARNNLSDPSTITQHDTLAKRLKAAGYETIYASDEKRFSNITNEYGFDRLVGPSMGADDFILGGLSDFPLSNLLMKLPIAKFLFPFNYGNRAAAITYEPDHFLSQVNTALAQRSDKPTLLAIHLCLTHWPFTWARDGQLTQTNMPEQYLKSVEGADKQLGDLLSLLKNNGLLENSIVVLLSDHGTGLGLRGDSNLTKNKYVGDLKKRCLISTIKLSTAPQYSLDIKHDFAMNTSYGQGNNAASLKQHGVILAFKRFSNEPFKPHNVSSPSSLLDISPTLLAELHFPPLKNVDGISLSNFIHQKQIPKVNDRAFFIETGDSLSDIESDHIDVEKILVKKIGIYAINPKNGLLSVLFSAEKSIIANKQLAVLQGDWLLIRYPASVRIKAPGVKKTENTSQEYIEPPFYVLTNLKTEQWTIGLSSAYAKNAPTKTLLRQLQDFYGDEL